MDEIATPEARSPSRAKTVQDHIDELPMWADGTHLRSAPMTGMQWLIWSLAAAGKFFEGFVVFMTGVALPLLTSEFDIRPAQEGIITAATLFGILVGAVASGECRTASAARSCSLVEMVIFVAFLAALIFAPNFYFIVVCLFGIGLALGCDYPTAHMIISENIPSTSRGRLVLGAFAFQAVGALGGTAVSYFVLSSLPEPERLALDVRLGDCSRGARHDWPPLHCRERQLAIRAGRNQKGRGGVHGAAGANRNIQARSSLRRAMGRRRVLNPSRPLRRFSTPPTDARQSSRRFHGSCRTLGPTASAFSPRLSWPPPWAPMKITRAASRI